MSNHRPLRGDIWIADFDPVRGREQGRKRPCVILSTNLVNQGPSNLVITVPLTSTDRNNPWHVPILPPEGGLVAPSFVLCEHIRSLSLDRFHNHGLGRVSESTLQKIEYVLKTLLEFS